MPKKAVLICIVVCALSVGGCAQSISHRMVDLRNSQGDAALVAPNLVDAEKEYSLALALEPKNVHARAGLAQVLFLRAKADFAESKLDEAAAGVAEALHYAPSDAATQALANEIDQAKIRREIVIANYPLYGSIAASLKPAFKQIDATNKEIAAQVKTFSGDFDTVHLTKAIIEAYDLEVESHRLGLRLITYRGLVQSGAEKANIPAQTQAPSLLPIP